MLFHKGPVTKTCHDVESHWLLAQLLPRPQPTRNPNMSKVTWLLSRVVVLSSMLSLKDMSFEVTQNISCGKKSIDRLIYF